MQLSLRLHFSKHFLVRIFSVSFRAFSTSCARLKWPASGFALKNTCLRAPLHTPLVCFCRCSSVLEIKRCVFIVVDNLSEGPVWLLENLLQYLWEYCMLSKERNPFRMNPQIFSYPWVWRGGFLTQKPPLRRGVCEDVIYSLYLLISVNNNVELNTSRCFQAEDLTMAFRWLEASVKNKVSFDLFMF